MHKLILLILLLISNTILAAEVNIYSARKEALIKPLLDKFTDQTGIDVNLVTAGADTLIKRIEIEGDNSPADLLLTVDIARLVRGKNKGLFQVIDSAILNDTVPARYRDKENTWFGLSLRSRVIVYAEDRVHADELSSYMLLADKKWKDRICVRSSTNVYNQSLVAAMIAHYGIKKTKEWAAALVSNFARSPKGGDRDQIKAVAAGVCDLALVNNYYLAGMLESTREDEKSAAHKVKLFWPSQNGYGAHINISGVALLKSAKNKESAIQLVEFLVSDVAQEWYADKNNEYPVNPEIGANGTLAAWGSFKPDAIALDLIGEYNQAAVRIMDQVGWK